MTFDITWHPLDEHGLSGTYVAALAGKQVGPETYNLASRWALRRLFKSVSDCYKRAGMVVLRDAPGFDPRLHVRGRPYFILQPEPEGAVDALVELETMRDAESIMQLFYRQMWDSFRGQRDAVDALARGECAEEGAAEAGRAAMDEFKALVHRVEAACVAAEGTGRVRTAVPAEVRRRQTEPLTPRYDAPVLDGLRSRSAREARLIATSELLSYSAVVWMWKIGPCWQQDGAAYTFSSLCELYPELDRITRPPSDLFDGLRERFGHVNAAMAQQLNNNYSAGRYIPAHNMAAFIAWWRDHRAELAAPRFGAGEIQHQKVLEAALYARVKNWSLIEASDVLPPFAERLP